MRILVVSPAWLGDFTMMQSLLMQLKKRDCTIDVLSPKLCAPLAEFMPQINQLIVLDSQHGKFDFSKRYRLGKQLKNNYDWAIVLPTTWKSALVPFFANIPKRTGFLGEQRYGLINDVVPLDKIKTPLMVKRYLSLIGEDNQLNNPHFQLTGKPKHNTNLTAALCPGAAYGPAKKWQGFQALAQALDKEGIDTWVFGSKQEQSDTDKITDNLQHATNYTGKLTLSEAVKKLSQADIVISNDSGLMHIACALGKKVIAIFGSSTPEHTPPLSQTAIVLQTKLHCRPCFAKTCRYQHYRCLTDITPERVVQTVLDQLKQPQLN